MPKNALPPQFIIQTGRWVWTTLWQVMMSKMAPSSASGEYQRPATQFHDRISSAPNAAYPPATGRYRLIVGMSCPWAHRTLVLRALKGLEATIAVTVVYPSPEQGGWIFPAPFEGCQTLAQLYDRACPGYTGRSTVPVLWDDQTQTIVNNESAEIIELFNAKFNSVAQNPTLDLYPPGLREEIERWNKRIYINVNNGVYRCGFAQTQAAYDTAVIDLFDTLDEIEAVLQQQRYLCGATLTLADVRLFTTLIRFDVAYYGLFKCDRRRIVDYPNLKAYVQDLYQMPGVAATCDLSAVRRDYYGNLFPLNPGGIVPTGCDLTWLSQPPDRDGSIGDGSTLCD